MVKSNTCMFFSILGGILFSFLTTTTVTWSSPIIPKLTNTTTSPVGRAIDMEEASWISSILTIGAILGVNISGYLTHRIGRKLTLVVASIPYLISHLIVAFATSVQAYYLARLLMGLTLGTFFVVPVYISELTHKSGRAVLGASMGCASCIGTVFPTLLGPFVTIKTFSFVLAAMAGLFLAVFVHLAEEVPQYYITRNREADARLALERLRGGYEDIDEAFSEIQSQYIEERSGQLRDILKSKALRKACIMCIVLVVLQQFCGINAILFYGQSFFQQNGLGLSPEISVAILGSVQLISSTITIPLSAKFGRKFLLCLSGMGMAISDIILAVFSYYDSALVHDNFLNALPIVCLIIFVASFSVGFGPLPWLISGEVFPTRIKAATTSLVACIFHICTFISTKYFMQLVGIVGLSGYFILTAICCILAVMFVKFYLVETKDKSLEEIQKELCK